MKLTYISLFFTVLMSFLHSSSYAMEKQACFNPDSLTLQTMRLIIKKNVPITKLPEPLQHTIRILKIFNPISPLFKAIAQNDSDDIIQHLINAETINKKENQLTPLQFALYLKHYRILELLLNNGANVNARNSIGETVLMGAARQGDKNLIELLLQHGANKYLYDSSGFYPIDHAEQCGHFHLIDILK